MSDITITKKMKISTLQEGFLKEFGLTLRVYEGRSFASSSQTTATFAKTNSHSKPHDKKMRIGLFARIAS